MDAAQQQLSPTTVEFLMSIWTARREQEYMRMKAFDVRFSTLTDSARRGQSIHLFDWSKYAPRVYTWASLCDEIPGCERVLRSCLLDDDLRRHMERKHPGVEDIHGALAEDQRVALVMMVAGFNVFVTGSAGVGKSRVVSSAVLTLKGMFSHARTDMLVTASTGVAAFNIAGMTLHSRLHLMQPDSSRYTAALKKKLSSLSALLIDEISMTSVRDFYRANMRVTDTMMALNNAVCVAHGALPFGGRQVIVVGDYFQLSDVKRDFAGVDRDKRASNQNVREKGEFQRWAHEYNQFDRWQRAFCTPLWSQTFGAAVLLEEIQRQSDERFMRFLGQVRWGQLNQHDAMHFVRSHTTTGDQVPDSAMWLFATNDEASAHNALKLAMLPRPDIYFFMVQLARLVETASEKADVIHGEREQCDGELPKHRSQATLRLNARCRLWSNYRVDVGIANGTQCEFVGLVPIGAASVTNQQRQRRAVALAPDVYSVQNRYRDCFLKKQPEVFNYTLLESNAFAIEWTGDNDTVELIMKPGDSSVYQVDQVHPLQLSAQASAVHKYSRPAGAARGTNLDYAEHEANATRGFCVAVRFYHLPQTDIYILPPVLSTRTEQIRGKDRPLITQMQIPLIPGYASTVHAAQGLTLESVAISLSRLQDPALPYVAMTRATTDHALFFVGESGLTYIVPDQKVVALARTLRAQRR